MKNRKANIAKQLKIIKMTKILVVILLGVSFALEFLMLNFISAYKEQIIIIAISYDQVTGDLIAVTDTIGTTVSQEYQEFIDYIKKKHEEKNRNTTENHQFTAFNLFFVDKFAFQFKNGFCLGKQGLNVCYQAPCTQEALSEIFHPPKV
jgi:hypothetical protein